ncbi:hypothetical protein D3C73_1507080 [compost metagenome]
MLDDYIHFLRNYPKVLLDGLAVIMQAAICYGINVDEHLKNLNSDVIEIKLEQDKTAQSKYKRFGYLMNLYKMEKF